jgi:hypothetical protein
VHESKKKQRSKERKEEGRKKSGKEGGNKYAAPEEKSYSVPLP